MQIKMTNANEEDTSSAQKYRIQLNKSKLSLLILIIILVLTIFIQSCQRDSGAKETMTRNDYEANDINSKYLEGVDESLYLLDYEKIKIEGTSSIDIKISNCSLYLDFYGDMIILGEVKNNSYVNKTDINITFDFYNKHGEKIISESVASYADYLGGGKKLPFCFHLKEREKYIDICKLKIGVNYKNYFERFVGNPVVKNESFYYDDNILIIMGNVINLGRNNVEELKLLATFYNKKDQVVFIKQCYLSKEELGSLEEQEFILNVLLDGYLPSFTHYEMEIFFKDSLIVKA